MSTFDVAAVMVILAALTSYLNYRVVKLPATIGMMVIAVGLSLILVVLSALGMPLADTLHRMLAGIDFNETLMGGMLGVLLFAASLRVNLRELAKQRWPVAFLAFAGVLISTLLMGLGAFAVLSMLGHPVPLAWCLVFGALISPTDPVAVLAIIRSTRAPKSLEMQVAGEALFNDGVAIVVFVELLAYATGALHVDAAQIAWFFSRQALGAVALGWIAGYLVYRMLRGVDNYEVEVLLTVALVMGAYSAARWLDMSGPITAVVAGLLIGNHAREHAMSPTSREHIDIFWRLVDSVLNALLFVLIGFEMIVLPLDPAIAGAALLTLPVMLFARWASVLVPAWLPLLRRRFDRDSIKLLTWGGLRGGISVALALALPDTPYRNTIVTLTYACVLFSVVVQGLAVRRMLRRRCER
ncbi:MAG TPA: sodium:proton antiporter [Casimicrobiaceae bacterium]|nr:sodium:proton antiporter [Casimicrobiaceae bacterium]